jgi:hypothetical protein
MNVAAHRLEIAVSRDDAKATRQMHAALLSDVWVRQIAPPNFAHLVMLGTSASVMGWQAPRG